MIYKSNHPLASVYSYDYGKDWIRIEFITGEIRTYTYRESGKHNVKIMIKYARKGQMLSSFIDKYKISYQSHTRKQDLWCAKKTAG